MDNDLISRAALIRDIKQHVPMPNTQELYEINLCIIDAPAVNAAPVVRCKDCKHFFPDYMNTIGGNVVVYRCELDHDYGRDDYFCADGERANSSTCGPDYCEIGGES